MEATDPRLLRALKDINDSLKDLVKTTKSVSSKPELVSGRTTVGLLEQIHKYSQGHGCYIPVELDWTPAAIKTKAEFNFKDDGRLTITINIEGEDVSIIENLIENQPVEALQLSSVVVPND